MPIDIKRFRIGGLSVPRTFDGAEVGDFIIKHLRVRA